MSNLDQNRKTTFVRLAGMIAAVFVFGVLGSAHATEEKAIKFVDPLDHGPRINVTINGAQTVAVLDTAATIPLINARMIGSDLGETQAPMQEASIRGLGGERVYPITQLESLDIGGESWSDVRVALNRKAVYPVNVAIVPTALFEARVVDFDFYNHRVSFYESRPKRMRMGQRSALRYEEIQGLKFFRVRLNGVNGLALLDTGANVSFVNSEFAEKAKGKIDEARTEILRGSDLSNVYANISEFSRFQIGDFRVSKARHPVVETNLFRDMGLGDQPIMVIGMDVLHQFRLQIDRRRQTIILTHLPERWRGS